MQLLEDGPAVEAAAVISFFACCVAVDFVPQKCPLRVKVFLNQLPRNVPGVAAST